MKKLYFLAMMVGLSGCNEPVQKNDITETKSTVGETWQLSVSKDEMRGVTDKTAYLRSNNSADLAFPYDGDNRLSIYVSGSKNDPTILLKIDNGQYDCSRRNGCDLAVKFGNSPIQYINFQVVDYQGSDGTILRHYGDNQFIFKNLLTYKKTIIEVPFYKNGTRQFVFNTSGFNEIENKL